MDLPAVIYSSDIPCFDTFDALTIDEYLKALEQKWPENIEKDLRTRLFWIFNHPMRKPHSPDDLHPERIPNIKSLYELLIKQGDSLFLAEIFRELQDFSQCIDLIEILLNDPNFSQRNHANRIKVCAGDKISMPFRIEEEPSNENKLLFPYEECIENGYFIFPEAEDVFAFSHKNKKEEYKPFLSVDLSKFNDDLNGWVTFTYKPETFIHRYDRLFTNDEWEYFLDLDDEWKDELIWFWSYKSWNLPTDKKDLSDYYRILFTLYHKADYKNVDYTPHDSYAGFLNLWREENKLNKWPELLEGRSNWSEEEIKWIDKRKEYYIWKDIFGDWISAEDTITDPSDLRKLINKDMETCNSEEQDRINAFSGLYYLDRYRNWFQGHDKTPINSNGDEYFFVGQIWSDYLNVYGSKLLYLFYDDKDNCQIEVYDYD